MAYIRFNEKLPSGIDGLYIYHDANGMLSVDIPSDFYTFLDIVKIRNILNKAIQDWYLIKRFEIGINRKV